MKAFSVFGKCCVIDIGRGVGKLAFMVDATLVASSFTLDRLVGRGTLPGKGSRRGRLACPSGKRLFV
jgi:hypothetical protein